MSAATHISNPQPTRQPTPRESDFLAAVTGYYETKGYAPSLRDIAGTLGVSHSRAAGLAKELVRDGFVTHEKAVPRSWRVVELGT